MEKIIAALIGILGIFLGAWVNNIFTWKIKDKVDTIDKLPKMLLNINYQFNEFLEQVKLWNAKREKCNEQNKCFDMFSKNGRYRNMQEYEFRQMNKKLDGIYKIDGVGGIRYYRIYNNDCVSIFPPSRRNEKIEKIPNNRILRHSEIIELFSEYNQEDFAKDCIIILQKLSQIKDDVLKKVNKLVLYDMLLKKKFDNIIEEYKQLVNKLMINIIIDIGPYTHGNVNYQENYFVLDLEDDKFKKQMHNKDGIYKTIDGNYYQVFNGKIITKLELVNNVQNISKLDNNSILYVDEIRKLFGKYVIMSLYSRFKSVGNHDGQKMYDKIFNLLINNIIAHREKLTSFGYMLGQLLNKYTAIFICSVFGIVYLISYFFSDSVPSNLSMQIINIL